MRKENMREKEERHLTNENKRLPDIYLTNYEKFKKRDSLKKIFGNYYGKPFTAFCILATKLKEMVTYRILLDVTATFII